MKEPRDPADRAAFEPRACPKCRIINRPDKVIRGEENIRAEYRCWSCRAKWAYRFRVGCTTPESTEGTT